METRTYRPYDQERIKSQLLRYLMLTGQETSAVCEGLKLGYCHGITSFKRIMEVFLDKEEWCLSVIKEICDWDGEKETLNKDISHLPGTDLEKLSPRFQTLAGLFERVLNYIIQLQAFSHPVPYKDFLVSGVHQVNIFQPPIHPMEIPKFDYLDKNGKIKTIVHRGVIVGSFSNEELNMIFSVERVKGSVCLIGNLTHVISLGYFETSKWNGWRIYDTNYPSCDITFSKEIAICEIRRIIGDDFCIQFISTEDKSSLFPILDFRLTPEHFLSGFSLHLNALYDHIALDYCLFLIARSKTVRPELLKLLAQTLVRGDDGGMGLNRLTYNYNFTSLNWLFDLLQRDFIPGELFESIIIVFDKSTKITYCDIFIKICHPCIFPQFIAFVKSISNPDYKKRLLHSFMQGLAALASNQASFFHIINIGQEQFLSFLNLLQHPSLIDITCQVPLFFSALIDYIRNTSSPYINQFIHSFLTILDGSYTKESSLFTILNEQYPGKLDSFFEFINASDFNLPEETQTLLQQFNNDSILLSLLNPTDNEPLPIIVLESKPSETASTSESTQLKKRKRSNKDGLTLFSLSLEKIEQEHFEEEELKETSPPSSPQPFSPSTFFS